MHTAEILSQIRGLDVKLWVEGDKLRCSGAANVLTRDLQEKIKAHKSDILDYLKNGKGIKADNEPEPFFKRHPHEENIPLSLSQQQFWYLDKLHSGNPIYQIANKFQLTGPLHFLALEQSLTEILTRHESLRTTFPSFDGQPIQKISPPCPIHLPIVDLQSLPEDQRFLEAKRLTNEETRLPFNLIKGPLFRALLLRLGEEGHILVMTLHHIITDGWSHGVFLKEISQLYEAYSTGKPSPLLSSPVQYADFTLWQRQWLQGERLEKELTYWKSQLDGVSILELPTDRIRPSSQTFNGASHTVTFSKELTLALKTLSRQEGCSLFMTLVAAFQILLHRYTGQDDIPVGSPISGRNHNELEGSIGLFINTLVLRTVFRGNPTFRDLLRRVREMSLGAFSHQVIPFEQLLETLKPVRDPRYPTLFQVLLVLQNGPSSEFKLSGLTVNPIRSPTKTAKFDLLLSINEHDGRLRGSLGYNTDLFFDTTIARMVNHLETLLTGIVANPQLRVSELPLLTKHEQQQVLVEWNGLETVQPPQACIHQLFEAQVAQTPDATAVFWDGHQLSYQDLNQRANQLARVLQHHGVGPEVTVGLCLERSPEMLISVLAILKAGGVYVPLDPDYPSARLTLMMTNAKIAVLVTRQSLSQHVLHLGMPVVDLNRDEHDIASESCLNLDQSIALDNAAYIIFTSGSTGTPKGVMIQHNSLVNFVHIAQRDYELGPRDRVLQFASLSFDASVEEIFPCLVSGGTLVLRTDSMLDTWTGFLDRCQAWHLTVLDLPTAFWHELVKGMVDEGLTLPSSLHLVIIGGERAQPLRLEQWQNVCPPAIRLINTYGPTESTVVALKGEITLESSSLLKEEVSLGRSLPNIQVYLLDKHGSPVPIGVPGEMYLGGVGLARGYLNRPDLTAEKFLPHPFNQQPGARLYRTGDLAKYAANGTIQFVGRIDQQVKLRGFRIELEEIQARLMQLDGVKDAIVHLWNEEPDHIQLVGYVIVANHSAPTVSDMRQALQLQLPDYMIPSALVILEAFPLTVNGKIDRAQLPKPEGNGTLDSYVAPRTPTEEMLVEVWQSVLQLPQIGIHDNFFELGGHSLLAMKLLSRVDKLLQREVPLRVLLGVPTIAGVATFIDEASQEGSMRERTPLKPVSRDSPLPLSLAQRRLWFLDQLEPGSTAYLLSRNLRLRGPLNQSAFEHSLQALITRHESLRTTFGMQEGNPVQVIAPSLPFTLPVVDLQALSLTEQEQAIQDYLQTNARTPFDLTVGPLLRATLLKLSAEEHVFLLTLHHIITDGLSMGILFRELATVYRDHCEGHSTTLPPLPIQYADYGAWQHQWLQGEVLEQHVAYWREHLQAPVPVLNLPTDCPRPAVQTHNGASLSGSMSAEATQALRALSQQTGTTLFMTVLAALDLLLSRWSGQDDVCVGIPNAGRQHADIEHVIGFFINTLVVRTDLSGDPTFHELLARVREATLGAYAHQTLPFEKLVEELQPVRDQSRTPFFQVLVNMEPPGKGGFTLPGLEVTSLSSTRKTPQAKFDLTVYLQDRPEGLGVNLVYNTDLFLPDRMQHLLAQFQGLLEQIVATPDQPISGFSLCTQHEPHLLPDPSMDLDTPLQERVHYLVAQWAHASPQHPAIVQGPHTWSYAELTTRAQAIGQALLSLGLKKGEVVEISGPSSFGLVASLLGVLHSGGVFLLVDPALPVDRQEMMRAEGQAAFQLMIDTEPAPMSFDENGTARTTLTIDVHTGHVVHTTGDLASHAPCEWPAVTPEDPAYIFFTSGTTGTPKAILGTHQGLSHFLSWQRETFAIGPDDRVAQLTGLSFDVILRDLFLPLSSGGALCLPEEADRADGAAVLRWLQREHITALHTVPTVLQYWLTDRPSEVDLPNLRWAFFAGEPLTHHLLHQWRTAFPHSGHQVNLYGPTETTLAKSFYQIPSNLAPGVQSVGQPLPHTQLLVLTPDSQLCGISELGEIVIRTPFRTLGYLNASPEDTQRFRPNPFTQDETDELYWTGDLGRYHIDGTVEILGRLDDQIKVNGVRIELGEVSSALNSHPQVQTSFVIGHKTEQGTTKLVAYVVPTQSEGVTTSDIRTFVSRKLIPAMVPSAIVLLEELPRTPNGKVNRVRLPEPEWNGVANPDSYVAAQTSTEEVLVEIWQEVLKIERIGIHDNFFELGGHSLLATQVVSRIREKLSVDLKLRYFFEMPSIAGLAQALDALSWTRVEDSGQGKAETASKEKGII